MLVALQFDTQVRWSLHISCWKKALSKEHLSTVFVMSKSVKGLNPGLGCSKQG